MSGGGYHGTTGGGQGGDGRRPGGIPDGLLVGVMLLLLGVTGLFWTATGLSGLLSHGAWPDGVTFTRTPLALRALLTDPRDLPGAWPDTPPDQLSGYGLFWGILVSQILVLATLAVPVLTTVARWRLRRRQRRTDAPQPAADRAPAQPPVVPQPPVHGAAPAAPGPPAPATAPSNAAAPPPPAVEQATAPPPALVPGPATPPAPPAATAPFDLRLGAPEQLRAVAEQAITAAPGPVLVVTPHADLWTATRPLRAKVGPTHLYDPAQLVPDAHRLRWSPTHHCEQMDTARRRAAALLAPVRPRSPLDSAVADTAETLLRCWLHAAAVSGEPFRQVHRWATGKSPGEAVRLLRTRSGAAAGAAGELESVLTAHPQRRDTAMALLQRALSAYSRLHVRNACTASRPDALALDSFVSEGGTAYLVGEPIEDPQRGNPGTLPFVTALLAHVVDTGRHTAKRSPTGRLDPPLTLVLHQVAQVAPLPDLPQLAADSEVYGFRTLVLLRSQEQARFWWPSLCPSDH